FLANYAFTSDGTLWALMDNETGPETLTIGRYDGASWHYHDLAADGGSWMSVIAAAGPNVVVVEAALERTPAPDRVVGLSVSTDAGATWHELTDPDDVERSLPFNVSQNPDDWFSGYTSIAFAGTSTLYVADGSGALWRSSDFVTFSKVSVPGAVTDHRVSDLRPAGDAVLGRLDDGDDLVRIAADGSVEVIASR
ncbi:MAG TPA: hypothetical protein VFV89_19650, partial [Nocardioides sp.]|uniref:hypothetical protein n=1 Tax=Nocardioides sp. TaxID=35761 RepID=UPI002E34300E